MSLHLFLVGFMGSGKSTVGRLVAERLARPFVDLDETVETIIGMPVAAYFEEQGEDAFRDIESQVLAGLEAREPSVVACGGGVVLRSQNRALLKRLGDVVYLQVTGGEAVARIGDVRTRPLLAGPGGTLAATSLLAARESLYSSVADATVDTMTRSPEQVAEQVVAYARGVGA